MKIKFFITFLLLITIQFTIAQETPKEYTDTFFKIYSKGNINEAIDFLYEKNPWKERIQDGINNIKEKLSGLHSRLGNYYGEVKIGEKDLKNTFQVVHFIVKYERQPLRFEFKFYKPNETWSLYGFSYDDGLSEELSNSMNVQFLELDKAIEEMKEIKN